MIQSVDWSWGQRVLDHVLVEPIDEKHHLLREHEYFTTWKETRHTFEIWERGLIIERHGGVSGRSLFAYAISLFISRGWQPSICPAVQKRQPPFGLPINGCIAVPGIGSTSCLFPLCARMAGGNTFQERDRGPDQDLGKDHSQRSLLNEKFAANERHGVLVASRSFPFSLVDCSLPWSRRAHTATGSSRILTRYLIDYLTYLGYSASA